ncbi:hypothetical protein FRC15_000195 [Serendipita sp. 397]|nr:hypothetical protein FRC15_000195 [Serendipita sp. 397]
MDSQTRIRHNAQPPTLANDLDTSLEKNISNPGEGTLVGKNKRSLTGGIDDTEKEDSGHLTKTDRFQEFKRRITGKHVDKVPTFKESLIATARSSWLNVALIIVVMSWISHFLHWDERATFVLSFLALIPLEKLLQFGSKQSMLYLGSSIGDLVNVTLMNGIEAILAILLLKRECELKLLQSTIIGVTLLQLLLVPGCMFVAGGSRLIHQELHQTQTQLNQSMMTMGVMCLVLPVAFFVGITNIGATSAETIASAQNRELILKFSRGMAIIMLVVYIASRIYFINPPGDENAGDYAEAGGHEAFKHKEEALKAEQPKISPWFCFGFLVVLIAIIAVTAEWLVHSIDFVRHKSTIEEEPLPLLFDIFEVVLLVAACFVVNYITADAKTNWAEGFMMISLYAIIALVAWFYPGQQFFAVLFPCIGGAEGATAEGAVAEGGHH